MTYSANFIIVSYEKKKDFFLVAIVKKGKIMEVGSFRNGLLKEEKDILLQLLQSNKVKSTKNHLYVQPGICVKLSFRSFQNERLVDPYFEKFLLHFDWKKCTYDFLIKNMAQNKINITNPDKLLFPNKNITKLDYIHYLEAIAPFLLPFLENRLLTLIRFPHGLFGDSFYQKQCPDYAPAFIETSEEDAIQYIVCNSIETLIWLGNQLAFEFHIPFETIYSEGKPSEIVFDLDPPSKNHFSLAIHAATIIKKILDSLHLISYLKTSGNKGIQVYIPLPEKTFTYEEVRMFTEFIAKYMVAAEPNLFTVERLKKNRHNRLYIDYIQHSGGKTIIAPFSIRGNEDGSVACPLFWDELTEELTPKIFTTQHVLSRLHQKGNPFKDYFETKTIQPFQQVLDFIQK
ncbi:MAG: DNA ligase D [Bacillus sp. (in: firmicutes)]